MNYVVTVELELHPQHRESFLPLMRENARASREREPGCRLFEVCVDPARPNVVFLYEVYHDGGAFAAHLDSLHFRSFETAVREMIAAKTVRVLTRLDSA